MADPAAPLIKRSLGNVSMHVDHVWKGENKRYSILQWKIEKFLMLKDTVRYTCQVKTLDWILKLDKKRYSVTITIESEHKYRASTGYINYECLKVSKPVTFEEVFGGVYKAEFGPKIVNHKENEILNKHGLLLLSIVFDVKWNLAIGPHPYYEKKHEADEKILSCEVPKALFSRQFFTDFVILVEEEKFFVHKAILRIRSPFFGLYIDEFCKDGKRGDISIKNTIPEVMRRVLVYIYEGSSEMPKDVDLRIRIYKLSHFLCISSLCVAYLDLLLRDINETNVVRIKDAGMSTGSSFLIQEADAYLTENRSSISVEDRLSTATSEHSSIINFE